MIDFKKNKIIDIDMLEANNYNPNRMPDIEMNLLKECILKFGFLFPIIATFDNNINKYRIIDGYHRYETLKRLGSKTISIIDLEVGMDEAIQLTILMNRIKGMHQVEDMSNIVSKLCELGLSDKEISKNLGMENEELVRLKQQIGIAEAFKHHEFSKSWDIEK